jgi:hypothetical protein
MALNYKRSIGGVGRKLEKVLLGSSLAFAVGDAVETLTTGVALRATAAAHVLGIIDSICDKDGLPFKSSNPVAGTASGTDTRSITTGASNTTYYAMVDVSRDTIYSAAVNGTLGTTNSSTLRGCMIDIDSAGGSYGRVLESTATRTKGVEANFYSHGVDPNDSTRLLVSLALSEFQAVTT